MKLQTRSILFVLAVAAAFAGAAVLVHDELNFPELGSAESL